MVKIKAAHREVKLEVKFSKNIVTRNIFSYNERI